MRWPIIWTICRKELLETVRDRRTVILMLFLPVVLYPMLLIGFSQIISHQVAKLQAGTGTILVIGDAPPSLLEKLESDESLKTITAPAPPELPDVFAIVEDKPDAPKTNGIVIPPRRTKEKLEYDEALRNWAREQFRDDRADVILVLPRQFSGDLDRGRTGTVVIFYDETNESANFIHGRVVDLLLAYRKDLLKRRIASKPELPLGFTRPLFIDSENVASAKKRGGYFAGRILPMMMIIMVMLGAFYPAVDLAAGEKERGTMQTLLTAPAMPTEIIFGKFITVFLVSLVSALANLGSLALALVYLLESGSVAENLNFQLEWSTGLILLLQLIPVALLFSALMLAVSIFAKSFKEAQNYLTPLYLVIIIPVILSGLPGTNLSIRTAWLPVLNITLLIKDILVEPPPIEVILMVLLANFIYSMLALAFAVRIFKNEQVLLGGQGAFTDVFRSTAGTAGRPRATPGLALAAVGLGLVVYFYVGGLLQSRDLRWGLIASQFLLLFLPVLLIGRGLKLDLKDLLSWRAPKWQQVLGAVLAGGTSWVVVTRLGSAIQNMVLPAPEPMQKLMHELMGKLAGSDTSLVLMIFAFAVTPAICEEVFFRGLVLSGFRNGMPALAAIVFTALCFGVYHISFYLIIPTAIIGLVITLIVWRTGSIVNGMIYHVLHNGLTLSVVRLLQDSGPQELPALRWFGDVIGLDGAPLNVGKFALLTVVFLVGLGLTFWRPARESHSG